MNCTYHINNPVSLICIASHKCELKRKMCTECQQVHGVDLQQTLPIRKFEEMVKGKFIEFQLDDTTKLTKERMKYKSILSQTESLMRNTLDEISELFKQIFDRIEQENKSFINLINDNPNLAQISYTELEILVQILEGKILNDFITQKNLYLVRLEEWKNWWDQEVNAFGLKLETEINEIVSFFKIQPAKFKEQNENLNNLDLQKDQIIIKLKKELENTKTNLEIQNKKIQVLNQKLDTSNLEISKLNNQMKIQQIELINLKINLDVLNYGEDNITLNVKSVDTDLNQIFYIKLKNSISDLYIMTVIKGIHKGLPLDFCLFVPSSNKKYVSAEWSKKFQDIFIPDDQDTMTVEFSSFK